MTRLGLNGRAIWPAIWLSTCAGCFGGASNLPLGARCDEEHTCAGELSCVYGRCRAECVIDTDCGDGRVCVSSAFDPELRVCTLSDEVCGGCPPPLVCATDGLCRETCDCTDDCIAGHECRDGVLFELAESCLELHEESPELGDGEYTIVVDGAEIAVYCDMTRELGGWTRIYELAEVDGECPGEWVLDERWPDLCLVNAPEGVEGGLCRPATFPPIVAKYGEVLGYVLAYQYGSTDAFVPMRNDPPPGIDDVYVDGVSITHGQGPRQHIWTLVSALTGSDASAHRCPCVGAYETPPWVESDYYCDSSNDPDDWYRWHFGDPLWDGDALDDECAEGVDEARWFFKDLGGTTSDAIEVRLCTDQWHSDEDLGVFRMELYVR